MVTSDSRPQRLAGKRDQRRLRPERRNSWHTPDFRASVDQPPVPRALTGRQVLRLVALSLVIILAGAGAGFAGALLWPATYAARSNILFQASQNQSSSLRQSPDLTTQLVRLRSREILGPVAASNQTLVDDFEKNVTISVVDASNVIQIEVRNHSRDEAIKQNQEIIDRYMQVAGSHHPSPEEGYLRGELDRTQADLTQARADTQMQRQNSVTLGGSNPISQTDMASAEARVQSLTSRQQQILSQLDQVTAYQLGTPLPQIVVAPYSPRDAVSPRPPFAAAAGALTALVIAAGVAAMVGRRWTRE